jgi:L-threonylcarbamoyladenylate synthase
MRSERIDCGQLLAGGQSARRLGELADRMRAGAVFVYPTETIYGLGGILIPSVKERLLAVKQREEAHPLIAIAGSLEAFRHLPLEFAEPARRLAQAFWPGNLTLVVPLGKEGHESLGVRVSNHPFLSGLARHLDEPLYSTSANRSRETYRNDPDLIFSLFEGAIDFMIDSGTLPRSAPSSVVAVEREGRIRILREGVIARAEIEKVVGRHAML